MDTKLYNFYANDKLAYFKDIVRISNNKTGKISPMDMKDWKKGVLAADKVLIKKIRNVGVTDFIAADIAYELNFKSDSTSMYMTTKMNLATEAGRKVKTHLLRIPDTIRVPMKIDNRDKFVLENNSRVMFSGEDANAGRATTLDLLYIEEVDFMSDFEQVFQSLLPCISYKSGRVAVTTTPSGAPSYFKKKWDDKNFPWSRIELTYLNASTIPLLPRKKSLNDIKKTAYYKIIRECAIS